jgi:hypothetical protein
MTRAKKKNRGSGEHRPEVCATPVAIQLSRRRGFKLPPGIINVARPGKYGNPFIVGKHGDRARCVELCALLLAGYLNISVDAECIAAQKKFRRNVYEHLDEIKKAKGFACWCRLDGKPCHRDLFIKISTA